MLLKNSQVIEIIDKKIESLGLRCIEIENPTSIVRLFIDHTKTQENGVEMQDCVKVTKLLLEDSDLAERFGDDYELQVCSPGLERPTRFYQDFENHQGYFFKITLSEKLNDRRSYQGYLKKVEAQSQSDKFNVHLLIEEEIFVLPNDKIKSAYCHIENQLEANEDIYASC